MATSTDIPIIDSHIHLYPESEASSLAWYDAESPLAKQHSLDEFKAATGGAAKGFIFIETDRKSDAEAGAKAAAAGEENGGAGWGQALAEVDLARRVVTGEARAGEGHGKDDADMCLAFIPWAPMPCGPEVVDKYIEQVKKVAGEKCWSKVRGFRYLLQDKPNGTGLTDGFIESLKLLGRRKFVFDLGVDQHRRGRIQLEEAVEMIDRAHDGVPEEDKVVFIINHMCKPDLGVYNTMSSPAFLAWRTAMFTLGKCDQTYMKLSGGFTEMPESLKARTPEAIFEALMPWFSVILAAFGTERIMFGSDWPVCTPSVGEGGKEAWTKWQKVVARLCWMATLDDEAQRKIWGGTALKAYGIEK